MIFLRRSLAQLVFIDHSGPVVARTFHRLLALVFLVAWLSLLVQLPVLIGAHGLMPVAKFLDQARGQLPFSQLPTVFWLGASDWVLRAGAILGILLSLFACAGFFPRALAAAQVVLYLSYVTAARTFLAFQWDSLLLECAFFSLFLPRQRSARWVHILFRLILFKLYWESGLAKWQSHLHDWQDGSAMSYYYETAPLPTALAWYMHHLPAWWHTFESRATLVFELVLPLGIFGPRLLRRVCAFVLTGFQIVNVATANYGFFCYLALALHLFLLDDADLTRATTWLRASLRRPPPTTVPATGPAMAAPPRSARPGARVRRALPLAALGLFVVLSVVDGALSFSGNDRVLTALWPVARLYAPFHVVNTYHLFGSITRERIEPELQTSADGEHWIAHDLWHKPGDPHRRPDWVAPHQPRVDFRLWFYGLDFRNGAPEYVAVLMDRLCHETAAVQSLFRDRLPAHPRAARIVYWRYHFSSLEQRRAEGVWWVREPVATLAPIACDGAFPDVTGADQS
jgi:lipase maturation factor 1